MWKTNWIKCTVESPKMVVVFNNSVRNNNNKTLFTIWKTIAFKQMPNKLIWIITMLTFQTDRFITSKFGSGLIRSPINHFKSPTTSTECNHAHGFPHRIIAFGIRAQTNCMEGIEETKKYRSPNRGSSCFLRVTQNPTTMIIASDKRYPSNELYGSALLYLYNKKRFPLP